MPLQPYAFSPASITVAPGTTVVWTNETNAPHTVTADDGSWGSDVLNQGDTYSYTFQTPGVYAYQCAIHSFMHGTVIVGTPPPTATSSATATPTTTPIGNSHRDQHSRAASLGDEHGDADDYRVANHHADRHTPAPATHTATAAPTSTGTVSASPTPTTTAPATVTNATSTATPSSTSSGTPTATDTHDAHVATGTPDGGAVTIRNFAFQPSPITVTSPPLPDQ